MAKNTVDRKALARARAIEIATEAGNKTAVASLKRGFNGGVQKLAKKILREAKDPLARAL